MARKVTVTETVTAELVPGPPPSRPPPSDDGDRHARSSCAAEVDATLQILGAVPGLSLAEQMVALTSSLGFAAHNATSFQHNHATVLGASTTVAVATLLGNTPAPAISRIAPTRPAARRR